MGAVAFLVRCMEGGEERRSEGRREGQRQRWKMDGAFGNILESLTFFLSDSFQ